MMNNLNIDNLNISNYENINNIIKFNFIIFSILAILIGLFNLIPKSKSERIKPGFIRDNVLPMSYFCSFSIILGYLTTIGVNYLPSFILFLFNNNNSMFNYAVSVSYVATIALFYSMYLKKILQNIIGFDIISKPVHDLLGFITGRIILIILIFFKIL